MAQTWQTNTWHINFWAESFWAGADNAVTPDITLGSGWFHEMGSWRWFWVLALVFVTN